MGGLGTRAARDRRGRRRAGRGACTCSASDPVLACLGSQIAGWSLSVGEGKQATSRSAPGPRARSRASEALYKELAYRDASRDRLPRARGRTSRRRRRSSTRSWATAASSRRRLTVHTHADAQPRGLGADRRALARGRPAQAARAELPARARRRRHGLRAGAAARRFLRRGDGPHERRHHLRRLRAALRHGARQRREAARATTCRARARATTAGRSPRSSRRTRATSTRWTACCSAPRSSR